MDDTTMWIIIGIVVAIIVIGLVALWMMRQRNAAHREKAAELRESARSQMKDVRRREAVAAESAAEADAARAEAEAAGERARRLEAEAAEQREDAREHREAYEGDLQRADELDPDVRVDKDGNRIDDAHADTRRTDRYPTDDRRDDHDEGTRDRDEVNTDRDQERDPDLELAEQDAPSRQRTDDNDTSEEDVRRSG